MFSLLFDFVCGFIRSTVSDSPSVSSLARSWIWGSAGGSTTCWSCWPECHGVCRGVRGGVRSRDLDRCCLLELSRCSTGGDCPVGDEGFTLSGSVTSSWMSIGCTCGSWGRCAWGYDGSPDEDRCRCLPVCGGWSSSPSLVRMWTGWGSGNWSRTRSLTRLIHRSCSLHQQVQELEAILVEMQAYLADRVVQDKVHDVDQKLHEALDEKENQTNKRKFLFAVMESWSHLLLRSQV